MHYLVYGTGAIGGLIGGTLAAYGGVVTFLARPRSAAHLRQRGLQVRNGDNTFSVVAPQVVTSPTEGLARTPDAILLAVKSQSTSGVIDELQAAARPIPPVVCLQNGVDNEPLLAAAFGDEKVIAATVTTAVSSTAPGQINVERERGIGIAGDHPAARELAFELAAAGVTVRRYADGPAMKWSKLLSNLLGNATSAICDFSPGEVFADGDLFRVEVAALQETLRVMRAHGRQIVNLPGVPAATLAFAVRWLPGGVYGPLLRRSVARGRGDKLPSLQVDLARGRKDSEVEYLNGAVARHAQHAGLAAPVNRGLSEILTGIARGDRSWDDFRRRPRSLVRALHEQYGARLS